MLRQSLTDPVFVQDPYPVYARARANGPVLWWEEMGMLAAFDHATINALLRDKRLGRTPLEPPHVPDYLAPFYALEAHSMLELEPPRHTRLRGLVLRAFTSRRISGLGPQIARIAADCLDPLPDAPFDLIPVFCQPIPVRVIARLLGVPESLAPDLLRWSTAMVAMYQAGRTRAVEEAAGRAAAEFADFLRGYVEKRRSDPGDDLITHLIAAEEEGERLGIDELIANCILLLNAGHEATVHSLGNAVKLLIETGTPFATFSHAQVSAAVEEILRFDPPLHVFTRYAYDPVDLPGGHRLERGDQVALVLGAAGRDPATVPDPDRFDPGRLSIPHLAFGGGIHFCVGAPLARLELQTALPILFNTLPGLRLDEPPRYADSYHFHKLDRLIVSAAWVAAGSAEDRSRPQRPLG